MNRIDENRKWLNLDQAINALTAGKRLCHSSFDYNEWLELHKESPTPTYVFEDGTEVSVEEFWQQRGGSIWRIGWYIIETGETKMNFAELFNLKSFADRVNYLTANGAKFVAMIDEQQALYSFEDKHIQLSGPYCSITNIDAKENQIAIGFTSVDSRRVRQVLQNLVQIDKDSVQEEANRQIAKQLGQTISVNETINAKVHQMLVSSRAQERINEILHAQGKELVADFLKKNITIGITPKV